MSKFLGRVSLGEEGVWTKPRSYYTLRSLIQRCPGKVCSTMGFPFLCPHWRCWNLGSRWPRKPESISTSFSSLTTSEPGKGGGEHLVTYSHRCNPEYGGRLPGNSSNRQTRLWQISEGRTDLWVKGLCLPWVWATEWAAADKQLWLENKGPSVTVRVIGVSPHPD